jgi:C1A family cysteine protease
MGDILPNNLESIAPTTLPNRRDFLKTTGTVAGLATAGAFTQLLPGSPAQAQAQYPKPNVALTPTKFDMRDLAGQNYISTPRDQGGCNACTAFAVIGAIEATIAIKQNTPNPQLHLSEAQLFDCGGSDGCETNAWYPEGALDYCKNFGVTTEANYGGAFGQCKTNSNWSVQKISSYTRLPDASAMKQWISGTGPYTQPSPAIAVFVYYQSLHDWNPNTTSQIYRYNDKSDKEVRIGGHVVCVVGYDDHPGSWICKNSWGPQWGGAGKGFFNMSYGDCHIDDFLMYGVVVP